MERELRITRPDPVRRTGRPFQPPTDPVYLRAIEAFAYEIEVAYPGHLETIPALNKRFGTSDEPLSLAAFLVARFEPWEESAERPPGRTDPVATRLVLLHKRWSAGIGPMDRPFPDRIKFI